MNQILKIFQKKLIYFSFFIVTFLFCFSTNSFAVDYEITNFDAQITLNQDLSLTIKETIDANFLISKHGIYRVIPYIYNHNGKTIKSKFKILGITNSQGLPVQFTIENFNQSKRLKIGDPNLSISGPQKYVIEYQVDDVVLDYGDGPEIYWNVTGSEWDTTIKKAQATVSSPFGEITKIDCFGCVSSFTPDQAKFDGSMGLTVVAQISSINNLIPPSKLKNSVDLITDNFIYLFALVPTLIMFFLWYTKGRDKKYLTENVFYEPDDKTTKSVPLFERPHLPLVYSPINNLTPAEVGTIIDEKVDTKDIVAEIVELARLKFLSIKKVEIKGFLGIKTTDYQLTKLQTSTEKLNIFQNTLLKKIFDTQDDIKISELKNHFYKHLPLLKERLYDQLKLKNLTEGNIGKIRTKYFILCILLNIVVIFITLSFTVPLSFSNSINTNFFPLFVAIIGFFLSLVFTLNMSKKTALGYNLHRQTIGLKYYLSQGKWRQDVMEKNLFLEEMLPLAIALGVVDKIAKDMKELGISPPSYMEGMAVHTFANDFRSFSSSVASNLTSSPSGDSSWSGGSGFSGGGGGGGFGGGGGGSW